MKVMKIYKFDCPKKTDTLSNGKIRCYYNENIEKLVMESSGMDEDQNDEDQPEDETLTLYTYNAVDLDGPITKADVINAIIREKYTQSEVEAIMRHKLAGEDGADQEFEEFNTYAELAKREAKRLFE